MWYNSTPLAVCWWLWYHTSMQYHIYDIIHMILHKIYYDIKVINYDIIEIYDIIVAQGSRWSSQPEAPGPQERLGMPAWVASPWRRWRTVTWKAQKIMIDCQCRVESGRADAGGPGSSGEGGRVGALSPFPKPIENVALNSGRPHRFGLV